MINNHATSRDALVIMLTRENLGLICCGAMYDPLPCQTVRALVLFESWTWLTFCHGSTVKFNTIYKNMEYIFIYFYFAVRHSRQNVYPAACQWLALTEFFNRREPKKAITAGVAV